MISLKYAEAPMNVSDANPPENRVGLPEVDQTVTQDHGDMENLKLKMSMKILVKTIHL